MKLPLILASSILVIFSLTSPGNSHPPCFDESKKVASIPQNHLYHKKPKPLVIGHHGNPSKYQENTVDGFKSLVELKADGMEFDTFLTKDEKLVVIHYDNTKHLIPKEDHNIWDITYEDLKKLDLPKELEYGDDKSKTTYTFDKTRKIPLLSEVIDAVKDDNLVMYLNMKPGNVRDRIESATIGREVAKLLTNRSVVDKVLLASFDPFKILAAKQENPEIVVGTFYKEDMWKADKLKSEFVELPGLKKCVETAPNGSREFMDFIFGNGALLKSTNGTFSVMAYQQYNSSIFQIFKNHYSNDLSFGAFIIDNLALSEEKRKEHETYLDLLIDNKASCLITDDVPRLLKKLGRVKEEHPKGSGNKNLAMILPLFALVPFLWFL